MDYVLRLRVKRNLIQDSIQLVRGYVRLALSMSAERCVVQVGVIPNTWQ